MLKFQCFAMLVLLLSCSGSNDKKKKQASEPKVLSIDKLFKNYHEHRLKLYPLDATMAGDSRYNNQFVNDITQEHKTNLKHFYSNYQRQLKQNYLRDSLTDADKLSYDVLTWECQTNLERLKFRYELTPINQFWSMPITMTELGSGKGAQPFNSYVDYTNWLNRLEGLAIWCDTAVANMKTGMAKGYYISKPLCIKSLEQIKPLANEDIEHHLLYAPVYLVPDSFYVGVVSMVEDKYSTVLKEKVVPAFTRLYEFMEKEYLPACPERFGAADLPSGSDYYQYLIKQYTTTTLSADEIYTIGLAEVERLRNEMETIKTSVGYKGDLNSFFTHIRKNKSLMPYTDAAQVVAHFESIYEKIKPSIPLLFDELPKTAFEIRRLESFKEQSASAEYVQGSLDGSRPGIFYVPVPNAKAYNNFSDEDLFLHEAIPGHHFQISLQQENQSLPEFRKTLFYSAYGEGWALYCESLGKELGLYSDPYQYFGMLSAEMHRAIRLVVDVGMHTKGMTREEAIKYSMENEAEPEYSVIAEIERYMAIPGQALSYKIGQLKIIELRNKAQEALGDRFDIKAFHHLVLESGCIPIKILEERVDFWIANQPQS